jgi:hypothetical protein
MFDFRSILPLLIPILLLQIGLMIYCLLDLVKRERTQGPKWLWYLLVILGQIWGPVLYLLIGRNE